MKTHKPSFRDIQPADFVGECHNSLPVGQRPTVGDFTQQYCVLCGNVKCVRSKSSGSQWTSRMLRQEQLLYQPEFASSGDPKLVALQHSNFEPVLDSVVIHHLVEPETVSRPLSEYEAASSQSEDAASSFRSVELTQAPVSVQLPPCPAPAAALPPKPPVGPLPTGFQFNTPNPGKVLIDGLGNDRAVRTVPGGTVRLPD